MPTADEEQEPSAVPAYENWIAAQEGEELRGTAEIDLFTDAHITGAIERREAHPDLGPYQILNVIGGRPKYGEARRRMVLRMDDHSGAYFYPDGGALGEETDASTYHGGSLADEIAALLSLRLGIRVRAGTISRTFDPKGSPKGQPEHLFPDEEPELQQSRLGAVLPEIADKVSLQDAAQMEALPQLEPGATIPLIRAARMYQEAVWRVDAEPELAWLLLVSAAETAADYEYADEPDAVELLWDRKEGLAERLDEWGGQDAVEAIADEFAMQMQGTKKFIDFFLDYKPDEPKERPPDESGAHIRWSNNGFRENMSQIYGYRSEALHAGKPFPAPMCRPPALAGQWDALPETMVAFASGVGDSVWQAEDIPMYLHTFEYIVRGALNQWWEELPTAD